jgi:hypothetical protein
MGVTERDGKFHAQIWRKHIGYFETAEDAATAYAVCKDYGQDRLEEAKAEVKELKDVIVKDAKGYYRSNNSTGYRGVQLTRRGKFDAQIWGKHIGSFDTAEKAAAAYAVYKDRGKDRQSEANRMKAKIEKLQKELAELEVK